VTKYHTYTHTHTHEVCGNSENDEKFGAKIDETPNRCDGGSRRDEGIAVAVAVAVAVAETVVVTVSPKVAVAVVLISSREVYD